MRPWKIAAVTGLALGIATLLWLAFVVVLLSIAFENGIGPPN